MTERTDQLLIEAFDKPSPRDFNDLNAWREYREDIYAALKLLDRRLEDSDREEYEALQKRMQQIQSRLGGDGRAVQARPSKEPPAHPHEFLPVKRKAWKCGGCERTTTEEVCPTCKSMGNEMTAPPSYSETDAGAGVGSREPPMTTEEFREQLTGLRDRATERRARLGLA